MYAQGECARGGEELLEAADRGGVGGQRPRWIVHERMVIAAPEQPVHDGSW
ncbi:hypothetical protein [Streptomyces bluensis]|uniref:hypothetical protein n=1 Tax=Streptomyces bluensis TaxID=33897 RepID=UPI00331EF470